MIWPGETAYKGALTPFTVAETPASVNGSGTRLVACNEGASCEPYTVACIPGAKTALPEALFPMASIVMVEEPPTTIVTGTLTAWGTALDASSETTARYTPFASRAAEACRSTCPGPAPERGETVSQLVVLLPGNTEAVHDAGAPSKARPSDAVPPVGMVTAAGETENPGAESAAAANDVVTVAVTAVPSSLMPVS